MSKSIVTEYREHCIFCGRPTGEEHHLIFGSGRRKLAEEDGLKVPCCRGCHTQNSISQKIHDNSMAEKLSKILGQAIYEAKIGDRESFRRRYGESYL